MKAKLRLKMKIRMKLRRILENVSAKQRAEAERAEFAAFPTVSVIFTVAWGHVTEKLSMS